MSRMLPMKKVLCSMFKVKFESEWCQVSSCLILTIDNRFTADRLRSPANLWHVQDNKLARNLSLAFPDQLMVFI